VLGCSRSRSGVLVLDIHFPHVRSGEPEAMPLLLTHGWPNSFAECHFIAMDQPGPLAADIRAFFARLR
jgi:pimeloyl-ACP methyl ester carboxylesterase